MIGAIARRFFGSANDRYIKTLHKDVDAINALEPSLEGLSDEDLRARTDLLRGRLASGETLDNLLIDAFATVREAAKRSLGQRHYDVQMMGGMVLHRGQITEMKTGEGKTLVATLAVYLNALAGQGVHVVTVNDYLAKRDAEWMGQVYRFLGLSVGCILGGIDDDGRRQAYACDVTYGTNNEFGFDYLRDNMKFSLDEMVQRPFNFAIVDEVDSILVDEARTPLIISGPAEDAADLYAAIDKVIPQLNPDDYEKDEKVRSATYTESGTEHVEEILRGMDLLEEGGSLYDIGNIGVLHHANQALRAHVLFQRDTDYLIKDGKVMLIDEFTGRIMDGRRFSEGLHQALEAKEGVQIQQENQTLASITFQNYFRMYPKLAGMTGTAMTEAGEFAEIYKLDVVEMPTNVQPKRIDGDDQVFRTAREKNDAIVDLVNECQKRGQPVLVGTVSIEKSEHLSELLKTAKIEHQVLNARYHEQEAFIVAQAGTPGRVTIATNMAGRGTDIQLGGNLDMRIDNELGETPAEADIKRIKDEIAVYKTKVIEAGGLYIIGTERHESRRIDNQLRGRAGRQGDPGASMFFLSLEDDLMRIFGSDRIDGMLQKLGLEDGEAIVHPWVNKALEKAQQKVEARNFEIRKNLLKFDDVMNDQRKVVYEQRKELMSAVEVQETIAEMRAEIIDGLVTRCIPAKALAEEWSTDTLHEEMLRIFGLDLPIEDWGHEEGIADKEIEERLTDAVNRKMAERAANYGPEVWRSVEKSLLLQMLDQIWKEHLLALDHLRQGIGLRAYAQRDPLNEYKREAFNMFEEMLDNLRERITLLLAHVEIQVGDSDALMARPEQETHEGHLDPAFANMEDLRTGNLTGPEANADDWKSSPVRTHTAVEDRDPNDPTTWGKIARNETCPCGSGKKYKHCHGMAS